MVRQHCIIITNHYKTVGQDSVQINSLINKKRLKKIKKDKNIKSKGNKKDRK